AVALSAYGTVKFYGMTVLGQSRDAAASHARDAGLWQRCGLVWLGAGCAVLGVLPVHGIRAIDFVTAPLVGRSLLTAEALDAWFFLTPVNAARASYSAPLFLAGMLFFVTVSALLVRHMAERRTRRVA